MAAPVKAKVPRGFCWAKYVELLTAEVAAEGYVVVAAVAADGEGEGVGAVAVEWR